MWCGFNETFQIIKWFLVFLPSSNKLKNGFNVKFQCFKMSKNQSADIVFNPPMILISLLCFLNKHRIVLSKFLYNGANGTPHGQDINYDFKRKGWNFVMIQYDSKNKCSWGN